MNFLFPVPPFLPYKVLSLAVWFPIFLINPLDEFFGCFFSGFFLWFLFIHYFKDLQLLKIENLSYGDSYRHPNKLVSLEMKTDWTTCGYGIFSTHQILRELALDFKVISGNLFFSPMSMCVQLYGWVVNYNLKSKFERNIRGFCK